MSGNLSTPATRWQIAENAQLKFRFWDDECVLYHGASGDTHRLPELVGRLLQQLMRVPADMDSLADSINLHKDDVESTLHQMAQLGIAVTHS
jgi:PqqD family protein of HPr-rel-A system